MKLTKKMIKEAIKEAIMEEEGSYIYIVLNGYYGTPHVVSHDEEKAYQWIEQYVQDELADDGPMYDGYEEELRSEWRIEKIPII